MKEDISRYLKNRMSESYFGKIDFDEPVDKYYYYGNHPVRKMPITNEEFITYIITYYQCEKTSSKTMFVQYELALDMYVDKFQILNYENLKSEEKELFSTIISHPFFQRIMREEVESDLKHAKIAKELGLDL